MINSRQVLHFQSQHRKKKPSRDAQQTQQKNKSNFLKKYSKKYTKEITASSKIIRQFGFNCKQTIAMIQMHAHERERERERERRLRAHCTLILSSTAEVLIYYSRCKNKN
jgi:hypothetical protein